MFGRLLEYEVIAVCIAATAVVMSVLTVAAWARVRVAGNWTPRQGVYTVADDPTPMVAAKELISGVCPLTLTTEEKVDRVRQAFALHDRIVESLPAETDTEVIDLMCQARVAYFDWIVGEDEDILTDDWFDIVDGRGRWAR